MTKIVSFLAFYKTPLPFWKNEQISNICSIFCRTGQFSAVQCRGHVFHWKLAALSILQRIGCYQVQTVLTMPYHDMPQYVMAWHRCQVQIVLTIICCYTRVCFSAMNVRLWPSPTLFCAFHKMCNALCCGWLIAQFVMHTMRGLCAVCDKGFETVSSQRQHYLCISCKCLNNKCSGSTNWRTSQEKLSGNPKIWGKWMVLD